MEGMNSDIINAIMSALGHVNDDEEGKKGKKMSVTVVKPEPNGMEADKTEVEGSPEHEDAENEIFNDLENIHAHDHLMDHADEMEEDDFLNKLKEMHPDEQEHGEMPADDWNEHDMENMHGPSMMMQLGRLKKKPKDEEDDGDHEYR